LVNIKSRLFSEETIVGCFACIPHPVAIEVCAAQGLDVLCIDAEHSQIDRSEIENLVRACEVHGTTAMVRVPGAHPEWIASALDSGARAILVPRVSSADEAAMVVKWGRYAPVGERGAGPGRASRYGYNLGPHLASANEEIILAVQIETKAGLDQLEAIAAVPGIDMLFVGPGDLATSLGATGPQGAAVLDAAVERIGAAARSAGKVAGIFRPSAADVGRWTSAGFSFFLIGSDTWFIGCGLAEMKKVAQSVAS
jgi:4-hydroxy-2-oxoheptanedioate aldolase